jgi:hypothetical protein
MLRANIVADLTRGRATLGLTYDPPAPIDVLLIGCEDGYSDTVNPRLLAADADLDRVHILDGVRDAKNKILPFSLAHLDALEVSLKRIPRFYCLWSIPSRARSDELGSRTITTPNCVRSSNRWRNSRTGALAPFSRLST